MIIEIHGAGFQNKGAELMLRTVVAELKRRLPHFVPAIDPTYGTYELRSGLALRQIVPTRSHVGTPGFSKRFLRQRLFAELRMARLLQPVVGAPLDMYGCVDLSSLQGLIDIAGFAYTDQWGPRPTQDAAALTRYYKHHKRPVILLPQAFGPFERPETRTAFAEVLENADLVFARDKQSWDYAVALASHPERVLQAPDITFFHPGGAVQQVASPAHYACLVPNIRLLEQGKNEWEHKYEAYFARIANELTNLNIRVRILVHDSAGDDLRLAQHIAGKAVSAGVDIVYEQDPLVLRRIIGEGLMLIGSRYHSLVSAFASEVPSISIGWSHKYKMLFKDFGCERFVITHECPLKTALGYVHELADPAVNAACREAIAIKLEEMRVVNEAMWKRVTNLLSGVAE
jgi:polysaccharide pyruvyl transferase WcaK-like protein